MAFQDGLGHWGVCGDGAPMNAEDRLALVTVLVDKGKNGVCWPVGPGPSVPQSKPVLAGSPSALLSSGDQSLGTRVCSISEALLPRGRQELVNGSQLPASESFSQLAGRKAAKADLI